MNGAVLWGSALVLGAALLCGFLTGMLIEWSVAFVVWVRRRRRSRG